MKKVKLMIAAFSLAAFVACVKTGPQVFRGNYSFKTSGFVYAVRDSSARYDTTVYDRRDYIRDTIVRRDTVFGPDGRIQRVTSDTTYSGHYGPEYKDTVITYAPDSTTMSITTESGQMDITPIGGNRLLLTMNCTAGDLVVYYAEEKDGEIILDETLRKAGIGFSEMHIGSEGLEEYGNTSIDADFRISGVGRKWDNIILFDMSYRGFYKYNKIKYDIYDSQVRCRAKENE